MKLQQALIAGTLLLTPLSEANAEEVIVDARDYPSVKEIAANGCAARIAATLTLERIAGAVQSSRHQIARISLGNEVKYLGHVTETNRVNFDYNPLNPDLEVRVIFKTDDDSWNGSVSGTFPLGARDFSFNVSQDNEEEKTELHLQKDIDVSLRDGQVIAWTGVDPAYKGEMCERNGSSFSLGRLQLALNVAENSLKGLAEK